MNSNDINNKINNIPFLNLDFGSILIVVYGQVSAGSNQKSWLPGHIDGVDRGFSENKVAW